MLPRARTPRPARRAGLLVRLALAALLAAAPLGFAGARPPAAAASAARGLVDVHLLEVGHDERVRLFDDYVRLRVRYLRVGVAWKLAEPQAGVYDEAYLGALADVAALARERGIRLVITFSGTPWWASDRSLWDDPPGGYSPGRYYDFYPPATSRLDDFGAFVREVATRLQGAVHGYECWNEPNLWVFLFPQTRGDDDRFAARRYIAMLDAMAAAVRAADPQALVIGGATAPVGRNNRYWTAPQRFARQLRELGAAALFDAYSHHPYVPGGADDMAPEAKPADADADYIVRLGNIETLLDIFPGKPFYLSEFGYNTLYSEMFAGLPVNQATQAAYLRRAYRFASRFDQVRTLMWYLHRDWSPTGTEGTKKGVYTGLRRVEGQRKRSWYAYAGGNRLTLAAPLHASGGRATLRGRLTSTRLTLSFTAKGVAGATVDVQCLRDGRWRTLTTVKTAADGTWRATVPLSRSTTFRAAWRGVVTSPKDRVLVP